MAVHGGLLKLSTAGDGDVVDITAGVEAVVRQSGVQAGVVAVFAPGATVAVTTIEFEPGAVADLRAWFEEHVPRAAGTEHKRPQPRLQRPRAPASGAGRAVRIGPRGGGPPGPGNVAADRARGLRRPAREREVVVQVLS